MPRLVRRGQGAEIEYPQEPGIELPEEEEQVPISRWVWVNIPDGFSATISLVPVKDEPEPA